MFSCWFLRSYTKNYIEFGEKLYLPHIKEQRKPTLADWIIETLKDVQTIYVEELVIV